MRKTELLKYMKEQTGKTYKELCLMFLGDMAASYEIEKNKQEEGIKKDGNATPAPMRMIAACAMDLGWGLAIDSKRKNMDGIAIGTDEYLDRIFGKDDTSTN